jgi:hypothetical protein
MQTIEFTKESLEGLDIGSFNFSLETTRRIQVLIQQSVVNAVNLQQWMEQDGVNKIILVLNEANEFFSLRIIYSMNINQRDELIRMKAVIQTYTTRELFDLVIDLIDRLASLSEAYADHGNSVKQILPGCNRNQVMQIAIDLYFRVTEIGYELENMAKLFGEHQKRSLS